MNLTGSRPTGLTNLDELPDARGYAWMHRGRGLFGWGDVTRIDPGTGPDRWQTAELALEDHFRSAPNAVAFASFTFDESDGRSSVVLPETIATEKQLNAYSVVANTDKIRYAGSSIPEVQWIEAVDEAVRRIESGDLLKVVLARDVNVWSKTPLDSRVLAARLVRRFPECYTFILDDLVGATPELLVRRTGHYVESRVLAGTAARSSDPQEDNELGAGLLASAKDAVEHRLAVESVTDVLASLCSNVIVSAEPELMKLANVQHLATRVTGILSAPHTALEIAGRLHPTAAVCGTPRRTALEVIRELEGMDRAGYGGPVGWMNAAGDGEFGIALRCAQISGTRARLFAGNGIVRGSLPEDELEETRLKLRAMQSALEDN